MAVRLYRDIESHSRDHAEGGYTEASELVGDPALHEEVKEVTRHIAMAALEGRCCDGSLLRRFAGL